MDLVLFILSVVFSTLIGAAIVAYYFIRRKKIRTKKQSVVLLEKVRKVCKLITVEGEFSEIHNYTESKSLLSIIPVEKKALLIVKAKAMVGFDLSKVKISADERKKNIVIDEIPKPETITVEPDIQFYDLKNNLFNKFSSEDFTKLNAEVIQNIKESIKKGDLPELATKQALETLKLIDTITDAMGWKLLYQGKKLTEIDDHSLLLP